MTKQDLQAIEDLLERKLDEKLTPINVRLDRVEQSHQTLERSTRALVTAVTDLLRCHQSEIAHGIERNLVRDLARQP